MSYRRTPIRCPECGDRYLRVVGSRPRRGKDVIFRRRECQHGHRFNTVEALEGDYLSKDTRIVLDVVLDELRDLSHDVHQKARQLEGLLGAEEASK